MPETPYSAVPACMRGFYCYFDLRAAEPAIRNIFAAPPTIIAQFNTTSKHLQATYNRVALFKPVR